MKLLLLLSLITTSVAAFALPTGNFNALDLNKTEAELMADMDNASFDFNGIVKLSNCSGSLIRFSGQPFESKAYVLTNGHCLGRPFLRPGQAVTNKAVNRRMKIFDNNKARPLRQRLHSVTAEVLVYGTMTGTDSAIYQLKETYKDLLAKNVHAFVLDSERPYVGMPIDIVSGYWDRGYSCKIDKFIFKLEEAGWTFTDSIRYSEPGCDTIGGTSGSPIVEKGTRIVVAINNTGNESGQSCTMNNPCEVDRNGKKTVIKGASYGQQTYQFYSCLTADFRVDTRVNGCRLTK